jgi:hypothetical protein
LIQRGDLAALPREPGADVDGMHRTDARFGGGEHGAVETGGEKDCSTSCHVQSAICNLSIWHWSNQILKSKIENRT